MFVRLRNAVRSWRNWRKDHDEAWAPYLKADPDGLNRFQKETERRLVQVLMLRGLSLRGRRLEARPDYEPDVGGASFWILAEIPELGADVLIYEDQTEVASDRKEIRLEQWDAKTPEEHIQFAEELLSEWIDSSDAA